MSALSLIGIVLVVLLASLFVLFPVVFAYSWVSESRGKKEMRAWWKANGHRFEHLSGVERDKAIVAALRAEFGRDSRPRTR